MAKLDELDHAVAQLKRDLRELRDEGERLRAALLWIAEGGRTAEACVEAARRALGAGNA